MRYAFISAEKANYPLTLLCRVMKVATSGYYAWLAAGKTDRQQENEKLIPLVREISRESDRTYGSRRMAEALSAREVPCGRVRAATLMRLAERVMQLAKPQVSGIFWRGWILPGRGARGYTVEDTLGSNFQGL